MNSIKIWNYKASDKQLELLSEYLKLGYIGIIPTDSMYALCCDALNVKAVNTLCKIKGINPLKSNLSIICSNISMASEYAKIENSAYRVIRQNTPGAFTFILKSASILPKAFKERKTVGIRIPETEFLRQLVDYLGNPIMTTSISFNEADFGINPDLIKETYSNSIDFFVEGEAGQLIPTTIIDLTEDEPEIIREGKAQLN